MKRVVSVLLLVCMLVSLMGMGTAAYAEELTDGAAVVEQTGDAPAAEQEQTGGDAEPHTPTATEPPQPTETPSTEGDGQNGTQEPEATLAPEVTAQPAADEGFFAALTDAELSTLTAELAQLGYTVTDRAGLYALAVQNGICDLENFYIWLDNELYILENAKVEANGKLYESLDEVVALLANDSARAVTAKLLDNAAVYGLEVPAAHELTLDLNGFALVLEMQEGETAPAPVTVTDKMEKDENGDPVYSYAALTLKNGTVSAGDPNALAIYDAGRLTLANVNVVGGIHVAESYERLTTLSIEPGDAFKTGFVNGAITADAGMENAIRITGGDFITDVSAYIDASVYECTKNEQTGLYTVARIKGTGESSAKTAPEMTLPALARTEVREGEVTLAEGVELENAAVALTGLNDALSESGAAEIFAAYKEAAPAQTRQAHRAPRALMLAAADGSAENADEKTAADGIEMRLTVKAELTAAVEGSSVSYEVKPYAVINGVEVPVKNEWLNGRDMLLSFYTGFLPKTLEHVHDDGTAETVDSTMYSYNKTSGMVTLNVREFSTFKALAAVSTEETFKNAVTSAETGGEIKLDGDIALTDSTPIEIAKDLTINLNGHTLSMTGTGNAMFSIADGVTLTIKGGNVKGSTLTAANYVADLGTGSTLVLGDDTATNPMTITANTTNGLVSADNAKSVTIKCATLNVDPSSYTIAAGYGASGNSTSGWTIEKADAAQITSSNAITGTTTVKYKSLKEAIAAAKTGETIVLLANISEGEITINKSITIDGTHTTTDTSTTLPTVTSETFGITGNIIITDGSVNLLNMTEIAGKITYTTAPANGGSLTLTEIDTIGTENTVGQTVIETGSNVTLSMAGISEVKGSIQSSGTVEINKITTKTTTISGSVTANNENLTVNYANVSGDIYSLGTTQRTVEVKNSSAKSVVVLASAAAQVTEPTNATFTGNAVVTNSITIGSVENIVRKVDIKHSTVSDNVTIGNGFNVVSVTGLTGESGAATNMLSVGTCRDIVVGTTTYEASISIEGTAARAVNINTVVIAANNPKVTIKGQSTTTPTNISSVTIGAGSIATFGSGVSDSTNDKKLVITTINSQGQTKIQSGTYEQLNGDNTKNTFSLNGGNYPIDYSQYCACTQNTDKKHYTHKQCKFVADENRWRVDTFSPTVISPASKTATVTRGQNKSLTFIIDAPYVHECTERTNLLSVKIGGNQLESKDYVAESSEQGTKITVSGDYISTMLYSSNIVFDTEVGNTSARIEIERITTNRRSGIIRTGDDSNIGLLIGIMVLALAVAVAVVVILKKKKSQADANDVTNKTKPKEPKE